MHFAVQSGVRAWIEERPLAEAAEAYAAMEEGRARYRMGLDHVRSRAFLRYCAERPDRREECSCPSQLPRSTPRCSAGPRSTPLRFPPSTAFARKPSTPPSRASRMQAATASSSSRPVAPSSRSGLGVKDMVTGAVALAEFAHVVAAKYDVTVALHTDHCPKDKLDTYVRPLLAISRQRVAKRAEPALPVAHVGRFGRADRREPGDRQGTAEVAAEPPRSSSRSRSASSVVKRTVSRPRSTTSCTPRPRTSRRPSTRSAPARTASTCWPPRSATCTASTSRATSSCARRCSRGPEGRGGQARSARRLEAVRLRLPRRIGLAQVGDRGLAELRRRQDERRHRHPVRVHPADRGPHVRELRRRAEDRRRGRQQEGLRPAQLPQEGRSGHDRAGHRGLQRPAQHRPRSVTRELR